jgi:hypothetical protein
VNTLLFVKGLIGLIVFVAAVGALITQLQSRKLIPPILRLKPAALLNWHRWSGRVALIGVVLDGVICIEIGLYPVLRTDPRHLIHSVLGVLLAGFFLGKVWAVRRKLKWAMKRIIPWGVAVFILQTGVFLSATLFAIWARLAGLA